MKLYRIYISLLLLFPVFAAQSQVISDHELQWNITGYVPELNGPVSLFSGYNLINRIPTLTISRKGNYSGVNIVSASYTDADASSSAQYGKLELNKATIQTEYAQEKTGLATYVHIPAVRQNSASGKIELLTSIQLSWVAAPALQARTSGSDASATSSVLSSGTWYKLEVNATGIYQLSYSYLSSLGIDVNNIDPRQIRVFGNGGGMLPQLNSAFRYDDLQENSIYVSGESDGVLNSGDVVYFYAHGPDTWSYNSSEAQFVHTKNLYSDKTYYYLTIGPVNGARVADRNSSGSAAQVFTSYDDRAFIEQDYVNAIESGRYWWGDEFSSTISRSYAFSFPGLVPNSTVKFTAAGMTSSSVITTFTYQVNSHVLPVQMYGSVSGYLYGRTLRDVYTFNASNAGNNSNLNVTVNFNKGSAAASVGYQDYLAFNVKRYLALYGNQTAFRVIASNNGSTSEFHIAGTNSNSLVWDITNPIHPENQLYSVIAPDTAAFSTATNTIREFVVWNKTASFPQPVSGGRIDNQDLHSIGISDVPDLVIVSHPDFLPEAERLANHRRTVDGFTVSVVTTEQVWNEFSSGAIDVSSVRDFMKMLYERGSGSDTLRWLLLMGDCSFDYKNRFPGNFVPVYESYNSLHALESFSSEDYFGLLDPTDGAWPDTGGTSEHMDIGVGRLPVKTLSEARDVVDKLIRYDNERSCYGQWQTNLVFMCDDGDNYLHMVDAEGLASRADSSFKAYNVSKLYLPSFIQVTSPGGETCPDMREAITRNVENGLFLMNYSGHGGETLLAQENILDIPMINSWSNTNKLPLMITATCDFGRYDLPSIMSGAEVAVLKGDGGTIANITSTRVVFAAFNYALNSAAYKFLFKPLNGQMPRMGDVFMMTKNASIAAQYNRNYSLLGDPSLQLAYPQHNMVITKINNKVVTVTNDTLKALSKVVLEGEVRTQGGALLTGYNGNVNIRIFDKPVTYTTLASNGTPTINYKNRNSVIYEGQASINAGVFTVSFVVPKDIDYDINYGKISLYGLQSNANIDASGYYDNIKVGSSDPNAPADNDSPLINLFLNDENFVNGGLTSSSPLFIAKLSDANGINISNSGIGHEIALYLDNSTTPVILNSYYVADLDTYQSGKVQFKLNDLAPGTHVLKLKAWDTYNNPSEATLEFVVANDENISLDHILNYPNPFSTHTTFHFDHNRAGDDLDVMIEVYTVSGKLVKTLEKQEYSSSSHIQGLEWDGRDDFGDKIGRGVYVYKVTLRSKRDGSSVFKYQKLVILN